MGHGWEDRVVPDEVGCVVDPEVGEIFCRLRCVLETSEEDDVVFVVGHAVTATGWRGFTFGF